MKIYTAIRRCMNIIFVMFGFFLYAQLCSVLFGFQFGLIFSHSRSFALLSIWIESEKERTCEMVWGWFHNIWDISDIISVSPSSDCCVSFTLVPGGIYCVVDFSLFFIFLSRFFFSVRSRSLSLWLHFCLFYISTEHTTWWCCKRNQIPENWNNDANESIHRHTHSTTPSQTCTHLFEYMRAKHNTLADRYLHTVK